MKKFEEKLNFVLASDENYADKLCVTMYSILENHLNYSVDIHILSNGISDTSIEKIKKCSKIFKNSTIKIYPINNLENRLGREVNVNHLSLATYARLFISDLIPEDVEKALYLDSDIIVREDISKLFQLDLKDFYVAGVHSIIDLPTDNKKDFNINAGVTLWNLQKCRKECFTKQCVEFINKENGNLKFHDQTIINKVCSEKKMLLPLRYNVMSGVLILSYTKFINVYGLNKYYSRKEYEQASKNPAIIHLTSWVVGRPWEKGCVHPYKEEYDRILERTPWCGKTKTNNRRNASNFVKRLMYKTLPGFVIRKMTEMKRNFNK